MSATKEHNHDEIEKEMRKALGFTTKKCKKHKWSPDGLSYPYVQCTICGRVKMIWD